jgi:hypothetical protein
MWKSLNLSYYCWGYNHLKVTHQLTISSLNNFPTPFSSYNYQLTKVMLLKFSYFYYMSTFYNSSYFIIFYAINLSNLILLVLWFLFKANPMDAYYHINCSQCWSSLYCTLIPISGNQNIWNADYHQQILEKKNESTLSE